MEEIWKDVKGYEGFYEVSNFGRVNSITRNGTSGGILKGNKNKCGYHMALLRRNGEVKNCTVHRLVALAFLKKVENKEIVNHIDGNKENNTVENLEWCDQSENQIHAYKLGLQKANMEEAHKVAWENKKRKIKRFDTDGYFIDEFLSLTEASEVTNVGSTGISQCLSGKYKQAGGFIWRYSECIDSLKIEPISEKVYKTGMSGVKGIVFDKSRNKWKLTKNGKFVGRYEKLEDAINEKNKEAKE